MIKIFILKKTTVLKRINKKINLVEALSRVPFGFKGKNEIFAFKGLVSLYLRLHYSINLSRSDALLANYSS